MSRVFDRHPWARWTLPGAAAAGLVAGGLLLPSTASADGLAPRTAEQLLTDVQQAHVAGLSGHVTETADLGLPSLPASMTGTDTSLTSLITGSHSARVWTSGTDKSRVAIEAQGQETDVVRNGTTVWQWSSANKSVSRTLVPAHSTTTHSTASALTPQQAAQQILAAVGPSTTVTTAANDVVANHPSYELVLTPKDSSSRIASVKIAIDGKTNVPLRVQVFSTTMSGPAVSIGFDRVDFTVPSASVFDFTPPAGSTVTTKDLTKATDKKPAGTSPTTQKPTIVGTGWTQIATGHIDLAAMEKQQASAGGSGTSITKLLGLLSTVRGSYGTAHVLNGTLVSMVITTDGRYAVGAVAPDKLLAALPAK
ncbi:MAG TPA: hypothetical protein VFN73_12745 [Propionibacteriaceae bacterium]|nr:hypothetical protein [Propionibacteriaceae bacterium]